MVLVSFMVDSLHGALLQRDRRPDHGQVLDVRFDSRVELYLCSLHTSVSQMEEEVGLDEEGHSC